MSRIKSVFTALLSVFIFCSFSYSADMISDGLGHLETTGLGSGGAGLTLTDVGGTWQKSGNKAVNTPTEGGDVVTNGAFTTDSGWTKDADWTIDAGDSNVATKAAGNQHRIYQALTLIVGGWYKSTFDLTRSAGSLWVGGFQAVFERSSTASYSETGRAASTTLSFYGNAAGAGSLDNLVIYPLTLSTLFLTTPLSTCNVVASADLTITAGTQAGLGLRLDSASSPTKGLVATNDGTTCKLDQFTTATTWTNLISAACTYSAGAKMVAITDGVNARLYYNNVLVGTTASVDAGITGTIHGLFSTSSSNSIDNLAIYSRGTEGQYESPLNMFIQ